MIVIETNSYPSKNNPWIIRTNIGDKYQLDLLLEKLIIILEKNRDVIPSDAPEYAAVPRYWLIDIEKKYADIVDILTDRELSLRITGGTTWGVELKIDMVHLRVIEAKQLGYFDIDDFIESLKRGLQATNCWHRLTYLECK